MRWWRLNYYLVPRRGIRVPAGQLFPSSCRILTSENFQGHYTKKPSEIGFNFHQCLSQPYLNVRGLEKWSRNSRNALSTMRLVHSPLTQPFQYQWLQMNPCFFHSDRRPPNEEIFEHSKKSKTIGSRWRERLTRIRYFFMRFRPVTFDDMAAMFSWIFVAHLFLILLATTGSAIIFLYFVNSLQFQGNSIKASTPFTFNNMIDGFFLIRNKKRNSSICLSRPRQIILIHCLLP